MRNADMDYTDYCARWGRMFPQGLLSRLLAWLLGTPALDSRTAAWREYWRREMESRRG